MTGGIGQQQLGYIIMKFSYRIERTRMTNRCKWTWWRDSHVLWIAVGVGLGCLWFVIGGG